MSPNSMSQRALATQEGAAGGGHEAVRTPQEGRHWDGVKTKITAHYVSVHQAERRIL